MNSNLYASVIGILAFSIMATVVLASRSTEQLITSKDNGKEITILQGETLRIEMECPSGTGYIWEFRRLDLQYLEVIKTVTVEPSTDHIVGSLIKKIWHIKTKKPGSSAINMIYKRPWESDDQARDKFQVKIVIK